MIKNISNYLNEISAIPEEVRASYLFKLKNRKGSEECIKLKLFEIIFRFIKADKYNRWDDEAICRKLKIDRAALYCHKSRLLKGLRLYYYGINGVNKEVLEASYRITSTAKMPELLKIYINAKELYNSGLRREAKNIFLKLAPRFEKEYKGEEKQVKLSELYEYIIDFYFNQRNLRGFNKYKSKLDILLRAIRSKPKSRKYYLLRMRKEHASALKSYFHHLNDKSFISSHEKCISALNYAKKTDKKNYILLFYFRCGMTALNINNTDDAVRFLRKGRDYAGADSFEYYAFESFIITEEFKASRKKSSKYLDRMLFCYKKVKESARHSFWFIQTLFNYKKLLGYFNHEVEAAKIQDELTRYEILYPRASLAWWQLYSFKRESKVFTYEFSTNSNQITFLDIRRVNIDAVNEIENYIHRSFAYFKNFRFMSFKGKIYADWLWTEFMKGAAMNFDKARNIVNLIDKIINTRHISISVPKYEIMKLGVLLIRDSIYYRKKDLLKKYLPELSKRARTLIKGNSDNLLEDYSIVCFIAQQISHKEVWSLVIELYQWIQQHHPEVFLPVFKEIEKSNQLHSYKTVVNTY